VLLTSEACWLAVAAAAAAAAAGADAAAEEADMIVLKTQ
jgi:hypothetical protein